MSLNYRNIKGLFLVFINFRRGRILAQVEEQETECKYI